MKTLRRPLALLCLIYLPTSVLNAQSGSGPADRQLTDPKSVASVAQPNPQPISIEALFGSRLIDSAALSPNGERGRYHHQPQRPK
jgi:hypothetical protein